MLICYFTIFIILGIIILKKLITKRKKVIINKKTEVLKKDKIKEISITESVPYFKYTKNLKIDIVTYNTNDIINIGDMFYIEEGSITITHNDQFVCKKQQNDFYFYALNFFINLENLHIQANERCRIWKVDTSSINRFVILTSLKKKVVEVLTEYFGFDYIFVEKELSQNLTIFLKTGDLKNRFQYFLVNVLKFTLNVISYIKTIKLEKDKIFKTKNEIMNKLIYIEEGSLIIKSNDKDFTFKKGFIFGYFSLFFNCYKELEIVALKSTILKIIDYEVFTKHGYNINNFNFELLNELGTLIHYIDLCSDWRTYRVNDAIDYKSKNDIIFVNEGRLQKENDFFTVKRLSDIIYIKEDIISLILKFDVMSYKTLFKEKVMHTENKIVSLLPNNKSTNIKMFSKRLKASIGKEYILLDKKDFLLSFDIAEELRISEFLNRLSRICSIIIISIENKYSRLAKFLHEISDVVLVVGYDWEDKLTESTDDKIYKGFNISNYKYENVEYVMLYENKNSIKNRGRLLKSDQFCKLHHVLSPSKTILFSSKDYDRLGRYLLGQRIGLVLSGGGARGIAHIGVIQALEEEGIPIDIIGGSSMGAFVGALYCKECDNGFVFLNAKKFCSNANSYFKILFDLTYPLISLFRGNVLNRSLKKIFRNDLIQNLWIDYFCVSTNLFTNEEEVHTSGLAWKYIRASMGLCGYVPPIIDQKGYLVDGGYLNNVPADVMVNMNVSKIIAVDVGSIEDNDYDEHDECFNGFVGLVHKFLNVRKYITMEEIQYRISFISSEKKLKALEKKEQVFVIRPELNNISTMDFKKFDEIVASGYSSARHIIQEWKKDGTFEKNFKQIKFRNLKRRFSV